MKEQQQKEAFVLKTGDSSQSVGMTLDSESTHVLMQMLSKNLYSDPIGSTVRETVSNALDSHRRIGSKDPILVKLDRNDRNVIEFSVEDFGTGLDADDVENIISKYGKSTKRQSDTELGMFGLGFKSPLAYSSSFVFIARKDGVERKYMMYEDEHENKIDLLYSKSTSEKNGVKVVITLNSGYYEYNEFSKAIRTQLAYFSDIFISSNFLSNLNNSYKILRNTEYQISQLCSDHNLHICLDDVYYPIDFKKLGIPPISCKAGLRFSLTDGLSPTPNRESIKYTEEAKKIIISKIKKISTDFINKYNATVKDSIDIYNNVNNYKYSHNQTINIGTEEILNVTGVAQFKDMSSVSMITPEMPGTIVLKTKDFANYNISDILSEYKILNKITTTGNFYTIKSDSWESKTFFDNSSRNIYYYVDCELDGLTKKYLASIHTNCTVYFVRKTRSLKLRPKDASDHNNMMSIFSLNHLAKNPMKLLNTLRDINLARKNLLKSRYKNLSEVVIPQAFIDSLAAVKKGPANKTGIKLKNKGEIICKLMVDGYGYQSSKFQSLKIDLNKVESTKNLYVYCAHEDKPTIEKMKVLYHILPQDSIVKFITISDREQKNISKNPSHNIISWEYFISGKSKAAQELMGYFYYLKFTGEYGGPMFRHMDEFKKFNVDLYEFLNTLNTYGTKYKCYSGHNSTYTWLKPIIENMITNGLYIRDLEYKYKLFTDYLEDNNYIRAIYEHGTSPLLKDEITKLIVCYHKKNHIRVNTNLYNIK